MKTEKPVLDPLDELEGDMAENPRQWRLTARQKLFVEKYLQCWNATRAAIEAGFGSEPGTYGSRLLKKPKIRRFIDQRMDEERMRSAEVLARLSDQARVNAAEFLTIEDKVGSIEVGGDTLRKRGTEVSINWDNFQRMGHLVKKLSWSKDGQPIIEFYDAQAALSLLGRNLGLFKESAELTGPVPVRVIEVVMPAEAEPAPEDPGDAGN